MKKSLVSKLAIAAASLAAATTQAATPENTPSKWVRYVESTGSQWVDTGVTGRFGTKAECRVEWLNFEDSAFLASRSGVYPDNGRLYFCYCLNNTGDMFTAQDVGANITQNGLNCRFEKKRVYDYVAEFSATNGEGKASRTVKVDGKTVHSADNGVGVDTGYNLYIFANNQKGNATGKSKARCYGLKIWQRPVEGGDLELVRNFRPCIKGDKAALFDTVEEKIYYASGGDLVCDENSEVPDQYPEYVESTGLVYIDTEVDARSGTEAECDFVILNGRTLDKGFLEAYSDTATYPRYYLIHSYCGTITCGYNTHRTTGANYYVGNRYYVTSSLLAGSQVMTMASHGSSTTNTIYSASDGISVDTKLPLYLFGGNKNGNPDYCGSYRLYSLKIKQDGVTVRDFRPCIKNGEFGLFDNIDKRIFWPRRGYLNGPTRQEPVKENELIFTEYIEADGTQTLDTGVPAMLGTQAKGTFALSEARSSDWEKYVYLEEPVNRQERTFLGADNPLYWPHYFLMLHTANAKIWNAYGNNKNTSYGGYAKDGTDDVVLATGTNYSFDVTFAQGSQTFSLDGKQVWSLSSEAVFDVGKNLHIFSTGNRFRSAARCYGLQIWQDGTLVRDFKPCIYKGKAVLYDTETKCVYRPSPDIPESKTGSIILTGKEKPANYVDYVESDSTIFVDTGVIGKSGTAADLKMQFKVKDDVGFLESRKGNVRYYLWHNATKENKALYGYDGYYTALSGAATNTDYTVHSSLSVGSQTVSVNGSQTVSASSGTNIDTGYNLYVFTCNKDGTPQYNGAARLYWLKLYQGDANGNDMQPVRDFRPVRLTNGLVVLWDFVNDEPYLPQSVTAPYAFTTFSAIGPDGAKINEPFVISIR